MKRGLLLISIFLLSISFVSAIGLGEALDSIAQEDLLILSVFLLTFVILNFVLMRSSFFRNPHHKTGNKKIVGVISLILSIAAAYGVNKFNFDVEGFLLNAGLTLNTLNTTITIIIVGGLAYLLLKLRAKFFPLVGLFLIFVAMFTDWAFQKGIVLFLGIALIVFWILIKLTQRKFRKNKLKINPQ